MGEKNEVYKQKALEKLHRLLYNNHAAHIGNNRVLRFSVESVLIVNRIDYIELYPF
jgi:hypothetical protein